MKAKAIALFSGGLDSTLSILIVKEQGIEVEALSFIHEFGCIRDTEKLISISQRFNFQVRFIELGEKFLEIVKKPKFGYGKNLNPCIDCRILMLKEAKKYMDELSASFIVTGEVLNQRPLSQRLRILELIDRESGLTGYIVRPLSAQKLQVTVPEKEGILKRDLLLGIEGRSRKVQIELAKRYGLTDYPTPSGGCLLTDPIYCLRLKELLKYIPEPDVREIRLLRVGRHFRINPELKAIVGRKKNENETLRILARPGDFILHTTDFPGPVVLLVGKAGLGDLELAAKLCVRYSDGKDKKGVRVRAIKVSEGGKKNQVMDFTVDTIDYEELERLIIAPAGLQKSL